MNDNIISILTTLAGVLTALGGWEAVKWMINRHSNRRIAEAQADKEENEADKDEFHLLREQNEFLQQQLVEKEKRFAEQTEVVRALNSEIIEDTKKIGQLELELAMKRCEVKKCPMREPQNGY